MTAEPPAAARPVTTVADALAAHGLPTDRPRRPVIHGKPGTLVSVGLVDAHGGLTWSGLWVTPTETKLLGPSPPSSGHAEFHGLTGASARWVDLVADASRRYLERTEEIEERLAEIQQKGRTVPLNDVWLLQRRIALLRAQIGRTLVAVAEAGGPLASHLPSLEKALPTVKAELERVQEIATSVAQGLSDLILLRNAEDSNRLADTANELSRVSNRIAALANISNVRMLGITYIALLIALVGAVVLIPNTGATILGMPSAAWVPGFWVDVILVVLAVVPLVVVFTRRWVLTLLKGLMSFEGRTAEGLEDLAEIPPEDAARAGGAGAVASRSAPAARSPPSTTP